MQSNEGKALKLNLSAYETVIVMDFTDGTKKSNLPDFAGKNFADRIASEIKGTQAFKQVSREPVNEKSVVVSGRITKYAEGNSALRLLVGFGAGSSHFDADVKISDSPTNTELGQIDVDEKSWGLGGIMAATQTVEGFMSGASKKIAKELAEAKRMEGTEEESQER
jgi:hypothetical protein